ncbi:MAG: hypothetical protein IKU17_00800 [Clostridia bacterium]|nr:hypothetical protein [Clostridia bacterium]
MIDSRVEFENGRVNLYIDGKRETACAYITYFDERSRCADFAKEGYEIYSLCASFSGLPLNSITGFSPLFGIFDVKGQPDYGPFDNNVRQIIAACPTAKIFPRVRVSMPAWWVDEHPEEVCPTPGKPAWWAENKTDEPHSDLHREALYSDRFRETGAEMLREFIAHIHASDYADHIIGYQIAGGGTEEWFHFDENASCCGCTEQKFNDYLHDHGLTAPDVHTPVPDMAHYEKDGAVEDLATRWYLEFSCFSIAETIAHFARVAKECVQNQQIVGVFFGYVQAVPSPLRGSSGLYALLECPDIDFFCSPVSYSGMRSLGVDWGEHSAGESIKQHGKLYFLENDIRTCLSDIPEHCRPGVDPQKKYTAKVWYGPETVERSVWAMRKSFARQLVHANALWWFDMWGGWYANPDLAAETKLCLELMREQTAAKRPTDRAHIAVLFDEKFPFRVGKNDPCFNSQYHLHDKLGSTGMTFDAFITEDYEQSVHYQAVLFPFPAEFDTEEISKIKAFLQEKQIPYVQLTKEDADPNPDSLRSRLLAAGVHCYCHSGDVVYHGNGFLCIHAAAAGKKTITLPEAAEITPIVPGGEPFTAREFEVEMQTFETLLFRVS